MCSTFVSVFRIRKSSGSERIYAYFDFGMIWGNTESHQSVRYRELFIHIHDCIFNIRHHLVGCVETRRPRSDDSHPKRPFIFDDVTGVSF